MNQTSGNSNYVATIKPNYSITIGIRNNKVVEVGWGTAYKVTEEEVKTYLLEAIKLLN